MHSKFWKIVLVPGNRTMALAMTILMCGVVLTLLNFYELHRMQKHFGNNPTVLGTFSERSSGYMKKPKYIVHGRKVDSGYLQHVYSVLEYFHYQKVSNDSKEWDIMWAHDYPFRTLYNKMMNLKPHQKVNHFPGSGYITNKMYLAATKLLAIPRAFQLPAEKKQLLEYVEKHPDKMFVQKSNTHRGIHIQKVKDLDLNAQGSFVQEYIHNPLLIDGHKFDIGVYTIITSIKPLRVYIYNGDILFRFCPVQYYPFDPENRDKYVVGDDYLPLWKVPSLKKYYNELGYSMKDSFAAHINSIGKDSKIIFQKIEDAIRHVILHKESNLINITEQYPSLRNFFEMMRFDFVIDTDLNVFIMEANMSPNLSSAHFPPNRNLYEQVLYNTFSLVGVGSRIHAYSSKTVKNDTMEVGFKNIAVFPKDCFSPRCEDSCTGKCRLCQHCLSNQDIFTLKQAFREHMNRNICKRIFPKALEPDDSHHNLKLDGLTEENKMMSLWFQGKCELDNSWCL